METFLIKLTEAVSITASYLDWVYMIMCFFTSYTVIKYAGTAKMKKRWHVLFTSTILGIIFGIMYWQNGGLPWYSTGILPYGFSVILSFLTIIFLNEWLGLSEILDKIIARVQKKRNK